MKILADNATLREHQLILDWLEQTSSEQQHMQVAHYADRSAMAWENTLHQLQVRLLKKLFFLNVSSI
jgi:Nuclear pore protein 84 / 107